ncbi:MAG: hypothetical protein EB015_10470 [Methylocystaceae bacterium]|nr:hypothetical protein [Methylocystaceae bacterium]
MPHSTLKLIAGVDQNRTLALNEAAISTSNLVRFIPDKQNIALVQKLGGWVKYFNSALPTVVRALWAWEDTNAVTYLGVGAEGDEINGAGLSVISNGQRQVLTPTISTLDVGINTTSASVYTPYYYACTGSRSGTTATITITGYHFFEVGDYVYISGMSDSYYNGSQVVTAVPAYNQFQFTIVTAAAASATGGSVAYGNGFVTTAGSPYVNVYIPNSNLNSYSAVYIKTPISIGGIVLFGLYQTTFLSVNNFQITARDALGNLEPAVTSSTSTYPGLGSMPVFRFNNEQSVVYVYLPDHGLVAGDTFAIIDQVSAGTVNLLGNYTVLAVGDENGANTTSQFSIGSNNTATRINPTQFTGTGSVATVRIPLGYGVTIGDSITITNCPTAGYNVTDGAVVDVTTTSTYTEVKYLSSATTTVTTGLASCFLFVHYALSNGGFANITVYRSPAPLPTGTGFGVGGYGAGGYGNGVIPPSPSAATTATSGTGSVVTITYNSTNLFSVGDTVLITGVTPAGYNGTYEITSIPATNQFTFAGTTTGSMTVAGTVTNVTSTGVPINVTDWTLDNWGSDLLSCPIGDGIFIWSPNSGSSLASIIPEAPPVNDGMFVAMPQRQIIAWGSTFTGIQDPLLVRWCDVNDYNSWIALPTNQAGSYRLPRGSRVVGCIQGPQQGLLWTDLAVWAMQYVGPPYVYQFNEVGTGCGLISRKAATSMNGIVYWMSQSQFYALGSAGVEIIPCPIWDVIFQDLDTSNLDKIRVAANSRFGEVSWFYPTLSNGGEVNAYVKYNVALRQWDFGTLSRTAWINQSVLGPPIGAGIDDQGTYYIYQHEIGQDADGQAMNSSFQTGYFVLSDGEWKLFIDQVWPDMKWGLYNGNQNAHILLTFYVTDYPGQTPRTYGPYNISIDTEFITPRFRGRLVSIKIQSDPNETGTFWRLGAMRYRFEQDGKF